MSLIARIDQRWHFVWSEGNAVGHRPVRWWWPSDLVAALPDRLAHWKYWRRARRCTHPAWLPTDNYCGYCGQPTAHIDGEVRAGG